MRNTSRRSFFMTSAGMAAAFAVPHAWTQNNRHNPFTLGVASGAPRADQVTLWTRLAPDPLAGGGLPPTDLQLRCRVCTDDAMRNCVIDTAVTASAADAHSVHFAATGLQPHREYFYQFYLGEDASPMGRTRTAPVTDAAITLALASCQHLEYGYYAAYRDMAKLHPDVVVHVGDYIYEYEPGPLGQVERVVLHQTITSSRVRQHASAEVHSLWDYRNRYAQYRLDTDLQAAHAAAPWIVSFDDHEVDNDWAGYTPEDPHRQTDLEFRLRRWAAFKAYYEHMPLERPPTFDRNRLYSTLPLFDRFDFGPQLQLLQLDTRQHRTDQPCTDVMPAAPDCPDRYRTSNTMTGRSQERSLRSALRRSKARWNLLAQQTWFSQLRYPGERYNMDQWDGYPHQRARLVQELARPQLSNPVVLSGDWHSGAAMRVKQDFDDPRSPIVAAELAGPSISTPCPWAPVVNAALPDNPHVAYYGGDQRGYVAVHIDATRLHAEFRTVAHPELADSEVHVDHTSVIENGVPGISG